MTPKKPCTKLIQHFFLVASVLTGLYSADAAELVRVTRKDGSKSQLLQKVITVKALNKLRVAPSADSKVLNVGPLNIFYQVHTDSGGLEENSFFRVVPDPADKNSPTKCFWIHKDDVQVWATRFAIDPVRVNDTTTFRVALSDGGTANFKRIGNALSKALILEDGAASDGDNGPFPVAFCVARPELQGVAADLNQIGEMSLEICFVLEDSSYLDNEYNGKPFFSYVHALGQQWATQAKQLSSGKVPVRLGLVVCADAHPGSRIRRPMVAQKLTNDLDQWLNSFQSVKGQELNGDYANDGLSGIAEALTNAGWQDNSAKHIVYMGFAPFHEVGRKEAAPLPLQGHFLNWLFDRTDPVLRTEGEDYDKMFGHNTLGKNSREIVGLAYGRGGVSGDEIRRWKHLHFIHIGQLINQVFPQETIDKAKKFNSEISELFAGKSPEFQLQVMSKVDNGIGIAIACWMIEAFDRYDQIAQSAMKAMAKDNGCHEGYYTHMEPEATDIDRVVRELGEKISSAITLISDVATGKEEEALKTRPAAENELTQPIFEIVGSKMSEKDLISQPVQLGQASMRDAATGRSVGEKVVMVSQEELKRLEDTLDALHTKFESKRKAADRQNTKQILDDLQASLATAASGQQISADTKLESLITDLPLRTEALRLTAGDIAVMSTNAFNAWLEDIELAQKQIDALLAGDQSRWTLINGVGDAQTKYSFLRLSELP